MQSGTHNRLDEPWQNLLGIVLLGFFRFSFEGYRAWFRVASFRGRLGASGGALTAFEGPDRGPSNGYVFCWWTPQNGGLHVGFVPKTMRGSLKQKETLL